MTDDKIALRQMLEKGSDATFLREMIGFAAQRLMELEVGEVTGVLDSATATATATGRPGSAPSSSASRSCGAVPISLPSWSPAGRRRRR